jgi:hypothetical protein
LKQLNLAAVIFALFVLALLLGKMLLPAVPYPAWLTELAVLRLTASVKVAFLGLGTFYAYRATSSFEAENPARRAWRLLSNGLAGFALGQAYLAFHQIVLGVTSPYPSPADAAFMAAYPFQLAAFWKFIGAYRESGLPVGSRREHGVLALAAALAFAAVAFVALGPVLAAPSPPLEKVLNVAYPTFDFLILVPIVILLRITLPFRGGSIWTVWAALLAGFVAMAAADILYAYFVTLGQGWLESLVDVLFILSYVLVAQATLKQHELLTA